jgi:hypothetical protein
MVAYIFFGRRWADLMNGGVQIRTKNIWGDCNLPKGFFMLPHPNVRTKNAASACIYADPSFIVTVALGIGRQRFLTRTAVRALHSE